MKIYAAFDDTDTLDCGRGTGKLARWFRDKLPVDCSMIGVVRHQLLVDDSIPYTSHNSSLCAIIDAPDESYQEILIERAVEHIKENFFDGSDPGLCVATENNSNLNNLIGFAEVALKRKVEQSEAYKAAEGIHLSGHGGTNDGIIGAACAVGLTHLGMSGRFIEYGQSKRLRDFSKVVKVNEVMEENIYLQSVDRNAFCPLPDDLLYTNDWLRPRLYMGKAILPVTKKCEGEWVVFATEKDHL